MTTKLTVETTDGVKWKCVYASGLLYNERILSVVPSGDLQTHIEGVKSLKIRDDDVYLAAYPKCGTHWVWEILCMLRRGTAEYETKTKEAAFLDYLAPEVVDQIPSPRVLNSHYPCKLTPREIFEKKIKIVHVMRNPKDAFVSLFHQHKCFGGDSFSKFLPSCLGEYGIYQFYPWFNYVKEWERFTKRNPEQILNLFFEDFKEDPVREIMKINVFLVTERDEELMQRIAIACDFHNLKKADSEVKIKEHNIMKKDEHSKEHMKEDEHSKEHMKEDEHSKEHMKKDEHSKEHMKKDEHSKEHMNVDESCKHPTMYRKGEVGDWKNHFTVADNEKMDKWLDENFTDSNLKFRYSI